MSRQQASLPGIYSGDFPPEYENYNTQYKGQKEIIQWTWYDTVTYVSGTSTSLNLFNAIRATTDLSNMEVAGQLAAPKAFFLRAIRFFVKQRVRATSPVNASPSTSAGNAAQAGALDNIQQLINTGVYTMTVGSKNYGTFPLWLLTAGGGACGGAAVWISPSGSQQTSPQGAFVDWGQNGIADPRAVFTLSKPLFISPQINFIVNLAWPSGITLAGGDTTISILWDGDLIRPVQ